MFPCLCILFSKKDFGNESFPKIHFASFFSETVSFEIVDLFVCREQFRNGRRLLCFHLSTCFLDWFIKASLHQYWVFKTNNRGNLFYFCWHLYVTRSIGNTVQAMTLLHSLKHYLPLKKKTDKVKTAVFEDRLCELNSGVCPSMAMWF